VSNHVHRGKLKSGSGIPLRGRRLARLYRRVVKIPVRPAVRSMVVGGVLLLASACGRDGEAEPPVQGTPVSDEEYMTALCTGLQDFSSALIGAEPADELTRIIQDYAATMAAIVPPRDISKFHVEYVAYLEAAEREPLLLVGGSPPLPPPAARARLVAVERDIDSCRTPTYFTREQ
jgi:hypothetical protein